MSHRKIFVNLAVKDVKRSIAFFEAIGFSFDKRFTSDDGACLVISNEIYAMLQTPQSMKRFTSKEIIDPKKSVQCLLAIQFKDREEVDRHFEHALKVGAKEYRALEDHGWMYNRPLEDLDGHIWEFFAMDESKMPKA